MSPSGPLASTSSLHNISYENVEDLPDRVTDGIFRMYKGCLPVYRYMQANLAAKNYTLRKKYSAWKNSCTDKRKLVSLTCVYRPDLQSIYFCTTSTLSPYSSIFDNFYLINTLPYAPQVLLTLRIIRKFCPFFRYQIVPCILLDNSKRRRIA